MGSPGFDGQGFRVFNGLKSMIAGCGLRGPCIQGTRRRPCAPEVIRSRLGLNAHSLRNMWAF